VRYYVAKLGMRYRYYRGCKMTFIDYKLTTCLFVRKSYTKRGTLSFTPTLQAEGWLEIPLDKSFILMLSRYRKRKALTT